MSRRSEFAGKNTFVVTPARSFDITSDYRAGKPIRGITEVEPLIELCEKHNSFISGGYARYCMSKAHNPIKPADLDIFSSDKTNHEAIVRDFMDQYSIDGDVFKSDVLGRDQENDDLDREDVWEGGKKETDFSISFKMNVHQYPEFAGISSIQFIKPSEKRVATGPLISILNAFDFTICKVALISKHIGIYHEGMQDDEMDRLLRINGEIKNPIATFARIIKYVKKGYNPSPLTVIQILNAWKKSGDEIQLENLVEMAQYQLGAMADSSELDKEVDFYELRRIDDEIERLQKATKKDKQSTPLQEAMSRVKFADVPKTTSTEKKNEIHLDRDGQLIRQARSRFGNFGD